MNCPKCSKTCSVKDTREMSYGRYRRYECDFCQYRFSTSEIIKEDYEDLIRIKDDVKNVNSLLKSLQDVTTDIIHRKGD